jgi:hypothetical protein
MYEDKFKIKQILKNKIKKIKEKKWKKKEEEEKEAAAASLHPKFFKVCLFF